MKAVLQRVSDARVEVGGDVVGRIGHGLLVLVCAERGDTESTGGRLLVSGVRKPVVPVGVKTFSFT